MVEPVIAIGVGFFIIMCMMVKFTGINNVPDIVDNTDNTDDTYDDIQNTSVQDNQCKIIQNFEDVSVNCIGVNIDTNIIKHDLTETSRILNFSAKHKKEIDLSGATLISLRSIKQ